VDVRGSSIIIDFQLKTCIVFVPFTESKSYQLWNGRSYSKESIKTRFKVDEVYWTSEFGSYFNNLTQRYSDVAGFTIYTMSSTKFPLKTNFTINTATLFGAIIAAREVKTNAEVQVMRISIPVSSDAHRSVMKLARSELFEYSLEAHFINYCVSCDLQSMSYSPIVGAGQNSAILHYIANDQRLNWRYSNISMNGNENFLLIDAGAEYKYYGSDITRTFPISGKFSPAQAAIYSAVLNAQSSVIATMQPGVVWSDMSRLANQILCEELQKLNMLKSTFNCTDLGIAGIVMSYFFPHGLGHHVGLDVHDSVVVPSVLKENMILAIEPGLYFSQAYLPTSFTDPRAAPYLNIPEIQKYLDMAIGGVRIEDNVLVTSDGHEILSAGAPRTIQEIENAMAR